MIAYTPVRRPLPRGISPQFLLTLALAFLFMLLLAWAATSMVGMRSIEPVPLVPCKRCAEKCPCPRMAGSIRCGCPE